MGEVTAQRPATLSGGPDDALWAVFREQADKAELLLYRVFFGIALTGFVLPAVSTLLTRDLGRNKPFFAIATTYALWFGVAVHLRRNDRVPAAARAITVGMIALLPWAILAAYVWLFGMARAIGTWEPIAMFTVMCVLSVLSARPVIPLVQGVVGSLAFLCLWILTTPPSVWQDLPSNSPISPAIAVYRAVLIAFIGGLCFFGARRFKSGVLSGARALRARDLFGKYRLHGSIGAGGMGSVVKATYCPEGGFERPVAIKRVLEHIAEKPGVVERFRAEAELGSRLNHPNIVAVLDFGRVENTYFFAMEYVDGPSLRDLMVDARATRTQLSEAFIARVALDVCAALHFAHVEARDGEGRHLRVVHRDLCPANILISRAGVVKLTDFGIARVLGDAVAEQTSTVVGKVAYMAPEILTRAAFDARTDIFSLGVVLWELLTGERLFRRSRHGAAALAVVEDNVPPPSALRPGLDPAWDTLVDRCLQPEAEDRYATVEEVQGALRERLRAGEGERSTEVRDVVDRMERARADTSAAPAPEGDTATLSTVVSDTRTKAPGMREGEAEDATLGGTLDG